MLNKNMPDQKNIINLTNMLNNKLFSFKIKYVMPYQSIKYFILKSNNLI